MILQELKNIKETPRDLKKFGLTIGIVLLLITVFLFWGHKHSAYWFMGAGIFFILSALIIPLILKPFNKLWMGLSVILGYIMTRVILSVLFFLVLTPIALIAKLSGKRFLDIRMKDSDSYWIKRTNNILTAEKYEKQY